MNIIETINSINGVYSLKGVTLSDIKEAENELELKFSEEYRNYLASFGAVSFCGKEFTGIISSESLNVISVTKHSRKINPLAPLNYYVVEDLNIDHAYIWQDSNGTIYQSVGEEIPVKIYDSLADYIVACCEAEE